MKKEYRIKKSKEIERVLKFRKSKSNRFFIVYKYKNNENSHFRYALAVGKKIGNAVTRNKVKRRIREVIKEVQTQINDNIDVFVIARKGVEELEFKDMRLMLINVLEKNTII